MQFYINSLYGSSGRPSKSTLRAYLPFCLFQRQNWPIITPRSTLECYDLVWSALMYVCHWNLYFCKAATIEDPILNTHYSTNIFFNNTVRMYILILQYIRRRGEAASYDLFSSSPSWPEGSAWSGVTHTVVLVSRAEIIFIAVLGGRVRDLRICTDLGFSGEGCCLASPLRHTSLY